METAIGVFASRERAENALRELLDKNIPPGSIIFLSRSESEAATLGKQFRAAGGLAGVAAGMSTGVVAVSLLMPGLGPIFALGVGAAALLGLSATPKLSKTDVTGAAQPVPESQSSEDAAFFKDALRAGRSLIVVRSESPDVAQIAGEVLDKTGIGLQRSALGPTQTDIRHANDIAIITLTGRITSGETSLALRQEVRNLIQHNCAKILLNLHAVGYVDSAGIGELAGVYTSVRNAGGQVRIVDPSQRVRDLLQLTRLTTVFDVQPDEATAIRLFRDMEQSSAS